MTGTSNDRPEPLVVLPDGTVKQISPLTGTVVWTIPGRAHRPFDRVSLDRRPVDPTATGRLCAFCSDRCLETAPEKSRLVALPDGGSTILTGVTPEHIADTVPEFRRLPNLFEILTVDYWRANHGYVFPPEIVERALAYTATAEGRAHVLAILRRRLGASMSDAQWAASAGANSSMCASSLSRSVYTMKALPPAPTMRAYSSWSWIWRPCTAPSSSQTWCMLLSSPVPTSQWMQPSKV